MARGTVVVRRTRTITRTLVVAMAEMTVEFPLANDKCLRVVRVGWRQVTDNDLPVFNVLSAGCTNACIRIAQFTLRANDGLVVARVICRITGVIRTGVAVVAIAIGGTGVAIPRLRIASLPVGTQHSLVVARAIHRVACIRRTEVAIVAVHSATRVGVPAAWVGASTARVGASAARV